MEKIKTTRGEIIIAITDKIMTVSTDEPITKEEATERIYSLRATPDKIKNDSLRSEFCKYFESWLLDPLKYPIKYICVTYL